MSIENNLERIAAALEAIATHVSTFRTTTTDEIVQAVLETPVTPKPKKAPKAEVPAAPIILQPGETVPFAGGVLTNPTSAPPAAPVAAVTPPPAPAPVVTPPPVAAPAPVAAVPQMTAEQLNAALVAEVGRIGAQEPIAQVIRDLGYSGIRDMPANLYQELLNRVKAL